MRSKTHLWKRSLAALLSLVMLLGMVPALGGGKIAVEAEAAPAEGTDYITLPITIRDFAADGMLFEYNEVDSSDTITIGGANNTGFSVYLNPDDWAENDYCGFRVYDYGEITFDTTNDGLNWHCVICDTSGNVVDVLGVGEAKETIYTSTMQDGYFSVWVWQGDSTNYATLAAITDTNKSIYAIDYNEDAAKWYIGYQYHENAWHSNYEGISYFEAGQTPFTDYDALWADCLICDSNGNVIQTIGAGTEKKTAFNAMTSGFALFATGNDTVAQGIIRAIAGNNPTAYQAAFVTDNYYGTDLLFLANSSETMTIHQADTKGFGLMLTGSNDKIQDLTTTSGPGTYVGNGTYGSSNAPADLEIELNSGAKQILHGATIRYDLVEPTLVNGKPVYTEDTVTYLANYMSLIMEQPWQNEDGSYNSFFVMGTKMFDANEIYVGPDDPNAVYDLAQILRNHVTGGLGSYEATMAKLEANPDALSVAPLCETWFDAAYYLLHYTWQDNPRETSMNGGSDGYGKYVPEYDSLHLVAKTAEDGTVTYVFNSGYDGTVYDPNVNHDIYNTQIETITAAQTTSGDFYTRGLKLPAARFNPLGSNGDNEWLGYGQNSGGNTYGDLVGSSDTQLWDEYYDTTNYHLSLEGHAEFIFHYSSNLYFTFTGDDDVYLYINGVRVLDLGAAHSIVEATIKLNDVMELCGLKEGEPARFDFFYLERHGTAANFGIETNIQLAASGMTTTKQGYQNGVTTGYNGPVDPEKPVAYSFTLKNTGDATLEHLTFVDLNLGVSLSEFALNWGNKIEGTNADGTLVGNGPLDKMYVYIRDENDAIVSFYSAATNPVLDGEKLKELLASGLPAGYSMTIYNLRYLISEADWGTKNVFNNVVTTTGIANGKQLNGTAEWRVRKADLVTQPFHIYNWVNKTLNAEDWTARDVSLTKAELIQPVLDVKPTLDVSKASVVLCNGSGYEDDTLWSTEYKNIISNVTLDANGNLTYNSKAPGMVTVFYKIEDIGYDETIYHFDVITYGVADNVYVLDYGLNVELNGDDFGFRVNDHLSVPQNIHESTITKTLNVVQTANTWGDFVQNGDDLPFGSSIQYQPKDIINGCDSMTVTIKFREDDYDSSKPLKFYGVDMEQTVTTAPANVVYYEENHPGITYVNVGENQWAHYETMAPVMVQAVDENGELLWQEALDENGEPKLDENGEVIYEPVMVEKTDENGNVIYASTAGTEQSADQNSNYGSDPNYEEDKVGVLESDGPVLNTINLNLDTSDLNALQASGIEALNEYFGLGGGDSNGTVNKLEVKQTAEVMYFDFTGTGFELISRTTMEEYAVINVQVQRDSDGDGTYDTVETQLPVITESKGGDLYQIPIISITGLTKDTYRVVVYAGTTGNVNRVFYVDGIRIYGPLDNDQALEYYNPAEYQAEFFEVKQMIENGQMIYADLDYNDETVLGFITGTTMVEDTETGAILVAVDDVNQYMSVGPNNELYMDGNGNVSVLSFILTPEADYPGAARTLQIGIHRKANSNIDDIQGSALVTYATDPMDIYNAMNGYLEGVIPETNAYLISSGTEMYYTIDLDNLTPRADGSYLIMVAAVGSEFNDTNLALTNFKVAGYTVSYAQTDIQTAADEGTVDELPIVAQTFSLLRAVRELAAKEPEVEQIPVNENLTINSAALSAAKVVSGRTVTLTVKAGEDAKKIVVLDAQGNEVTATRCTSKLSRGVVTFTFTYKVTGTSGQALNYTVRVYDADGLASVNTESVTVTIR